MLKKHKLPVWKLRIHVSCEKEDTSVDAKHILAELHRLSKLENPQDDEEVEPFASIPNCFRWKPSPEIRKVIGEERIVFTLNPENGSLDVLAFGDRDKVYTKPKRRANQPKFFNLGEE